MSIRHLRMAVLTFILLPGTSVFHAQQAPAAGAPSKVGVINLIEAISLTTEGKHAAGELQSQFLPRQQELEALNKQINDLRQRLNSQPPLSDEETAHITNQGARLEQRLDRKRNEYQEDLNAAQSEVINTIGRKMMDALDRYAQEKGYVQVFDSSTQNSPVQFVAPSYEFTQDIVRLHDQAHPVKAASASPEAQPPVAPKPAAATTSKPR